MSNRYLDKVAGVRELGHMARAVGDVAKGNPMTVAFGAGGALEGALSTTPQHNEGDVRVALRGVKNTIIGGAKGAAAGKALELGYQHIKGVANERAGNKYLHKAAAIMDGPKQLTQRAGKVWKEIPVANKISIGMGAAGLGLSLVNAAGNHGRKSEQAEQVQVNKQSLNVLKRIHKALSSTPTPSMQKEAKEEDNSDGRRILGGATAFYGAGLANEQYHRGHLTGRETLYHGSSAKNIESIKAHGLQPNRGEKGVSNLVGDLATKNKNLTFTDKRKFYAHTYGIQQEAIDSGKIKNPAELVGHQPHTLKGALKQYVTRDPKNVAEINLPTWKSDYKGVTNPEVKHQLRNLKQNFRYRIQPKSLQEMQRKAIVNTYQTNVHVVRGRHGVGTEYIKGSKTYRGNSLKEIAEYLGHNKGRFAKGVGKTLGGIGMAAAGAHLFANANKQ